ncbi:MAG: solute-binding protein [Tissierellia bacterium]|jgi:tungstate transport system substrate-binding protein|nr:solute-binding protein [Tissierellia bacterium]
MKKSLVLVVAFILVFSMLVGCSPKKPEVVDTPPVETPETPETPDVADEPVVEDKGEIILSTTTSTEDSGLLDFILPIFTEDTGIVVKTVSVGTGKALQMARDGEADVLLVHAKPDELILVEEGHGTERRDVMYNDFVLVGPKDGPIAKSSDIEGALKEISDQGLTFVSRGDDSGTHKKELSIWKAAGVEPEGKWYLEAGAGMGDVLKIADESLGYTLTDRATYLSMQDTLDLEIVVEGNEVMFNQYGVIPVDPGKANINHEGAVEFMNWITSNKGQDLIKDFGVEEYGEPLFIPNYK